MNSSSISPTSQSFSNDYLTIALGVLFIVSEVLPLIKKTKSNGLIDGLICLLKGSKCVIDKSLEIVEKVDENSQKSHNLKLSSSKTDLPKNDFASAPDISVEIS
eukprot:COSAG01_NODE_4455_length_5006_cov_4.723049_3_plen_104_part_00